MFSYRIFSTMILYNYSIITILPKFILSVPFILYYRSIFCNKKFYRIRLFPYFSLSVSLFLSLFVTLFLFIFLYLSLSLSLTVCYSLSLYLSLSVFLILLLSLSLPLSFILLFTLCLSHSLNFNLHIFHNHPLFLLIFSFRWENNTVII